MARATILLALVALATAGPAPAQILAALKAVRNNQPPTQPFDPRTAPAAPDYRADASWAALPQTRDAADGTPAGVRAGDQMRAPVDVFFVYPTTFFSKTQWNAAITDRTNNAAIDAGPLRGQASVFNGCCAIYAPRYRQMTLGGFVKWSANSEAAMDLAYGDVSRAFDEFLRRTNGRPFIIAGHSQGSRLARRLVAERIDGTPLARRMVAAYLVGTWIERAWFDGLRDVKPCTGATDTGCVLSWSSFAEGRNAPAQRITLGRSSGYRPEVVGRDYVCINPLSWSAGPAKADKSLNHGAWLYGPGPRPRPLDVGLMSARCRDGALYVSPPGIKLYTDLVIPFGNFHNLDYNVAWMNVRENVQRRVDAYARARP
jgi:hypothetical protein